VIPAGEPAKMLVAAGPVPDGALPGLAFV
jgi:hypothetical protein